MKHTSWLLPLTLLLLLSGSDTPTPASAQPAQLASAQSPDREIVGYVADFSNPGQLVLADKVGVSVNNRTRYWVQPMGGGKRRMGTINDVVIEHKVRVLLGPNNLAKAVTVIEGW